MLALTRRQARTLIALSSVLVPLELRAFGQGVGWGLTFPVGLFVYAPGQIAGMPGQFRTPVTEYQLLNRYDPGGQIGVIGWIVAAGIVLVTAAFVLTLEWDEAWTPNRLRAAGVGFAGAGTLFVLTRIPMYEFVFVSSSEMPNWFTVPLGALYLVFVGAVFVRWSRDTHDPREGNG